MATEKEDSGKYVIGDLNDDCISELKCPSGPTLKYTYLNGRNMKIDFNFSGFVPDPRTHYPAVRNNMKIFSNDVVICAYPKSGTHWVWEMVQMLQKGKAEYDPRPKEVTMMEFHSLEILTREKRPRVYNTHMFPQEIPQAFLEGTGKVIFIQRNPKDILVSFYCHNMNNKLNTAYDWRDFVYMAVNYGGYGTDWFDYTKKWEEEIMRNKTDILSLYYEDIKKSPEETVKKIAKFIGISCSDDLAKEIADKCSFKNLKAANRNKFDNINNTGPNPSFKDPDLMYRKGEVGDWKNWFTVAQSEEFDEVFRAKMKDSTFKYEF